MTCDRCRILFGLKWLCVCNNGRDAAMVRHAELVEREQFGDPETWYAREVERMRERAPA